MIRAVGFDLGDTLIYYPGVPLNWLSLYRGALVNIGRVCGVELTEPMLDDGQEVLALYNTRLHPRREEVTFRSILASLFSAWNASPEKLEDAAEAAFFDTFQRHATLYNDVLPALQDLQQRDIVAGLLTDVPYGMSSRFVARDIAPFEDYLDIWFTSCTVEVRKPDPDGFEMLMSALGVWKDEMLYVGNEEKDIVGANRAGLYSVLIDRESTGSNYGQWKTIQSLSELPRLL